MESPDPASPAEYRLRHRIAIVLFSDFEGGCNEFVSLLIAKQHDSGSDNYSKNWLIFSAFGRGTPRNKPVANVSRVG